ncbi:hypothetical protein Dimus_037079, partial [Dionaea muscipula]
EGGGLRAPSSSTKNSKPSPTTTPRAEPITITRLPTPFPLHPSPPREDAAAAVGCYSPAFIIIIHRLPNSLSASITGRGKHITSAACTEHDRGREEQQHATALLNCSLPPFSRRRRRYFIKGVEIEAKLRVIGSWVNS